MAAMRACTFGSLADSGVMTGMPALVASSATLVNQMRALGSSVWVMTSCTSTPPSSSACRQRAPTSWYAKTTAFIGLAILFQDGLDYKAWAAAYLFIDTTDVFAEQAHAEEQYANQRKDQGKQRKHPFDFGTEDKATQQQQKEQGR